MELRKIVFLHLMVLFPIVVFAQSEKRSFDLRTCLDYAQQHYPVLKQAEIDQQITDQNVKLNESVWYPQVSFNTQFQHSEKDQVGTIFIDDRTYSVNLTAKNINPFNFSANQVLFNKNALYASKTASPYRKQTDLKMQSRWIDVQANVSKAFYNVMLQQQQMKIYASDIERLNESLKNAQSQYEAGIVDRTDVQRSKIELNNAYASYQSARQMVNISYAGLKQTMGYNESSDFSVETDIQSLIPEMYMDTMVMPEINNRVEYSLLQVQNKLLSLNLAYSRWAYIPEVSLFGNYTATFSSDDYSSLYPNGAYWNYNFGVTLSLPLFDGLSRIRQTKLAKLALKRNEWDFESLKSDINTEFVNAMSIYKSNLESYNFLKQNMEDASTVYDIILLQYKEGIKTFLDLTTSHTDLLSAQLAYYNAIFQVIVSKVDVEKSLGLIR